MRKISKVSLLGNYSCLRFFKSLNKYPNFQKWKSSLRKKLLEVLSAMIMQFSVNNRAQSLLLVRVFGLKKDFAVSVESLVN